MIRGIFLGDFFGIEKGDWILLWSGVLGAILSAAVAAAVAVVVLTRSNANQRRLAAEALADQKAQGEQQLAQQRAEAARVREQAAIAEVIIATERYMHSARETPHEVTRHLSIFQAAVARWRVEIGRGPMEKELFDWTELIFVVALRQSKVEGESGENMLILARVIAGFSGLALDWATADGLSRGALREESERRRLQIAASFEQLSKV